MVQQIVAMLNSGNGRKQELALMVLIQSGEYGELPR
jgi:hypothetical protein